MMSLSPNLPDSSMRQIAYVIEDARLPSATATIGRGWTGRARFRSRMSGVSAAMIGDNGDSS